MQIDEIGKLMEFMKANDLNVLELEEGGSRLLLERHMPTVPASASAVLPQAAAASDALDSAEKSGQLILSPVVGVFYESPAQDAEPFVQVGSVVEVGSPLCIIEAMKLMNEVSSAFDGIVLEIFVENGQRVEYGQPLMRIGGDVSC
ncbi:MAG: acetyl-CoA carboxylase biotin carboxyl carrier protein [Clostridiaceae bacterium]|nr:acetyl-CoA carboxylase biotin carboxyl carrier protein [Clostridiaceae bacterium]